MQHFIPSLPALLASAVLASTGLVAATPAAAAGWSTVSGAAPIVIGHRGASGYRPEHTLAAYDLAISQGANFIEPDLVMTKDGELLARHEPMLARVNLNADGSIKYVNGVPELNRTDTSTNVWQLPQYAGRLQVKTLDGQKVGGWWVEDFTAAEIRADIFAQERLRDLRTGNNAYNDQYRIPTLQEVIDLAKARSATLGRTIGIYPETKHPTYFAAVAQANGVQRMEDRLVSILHANYGNTASAPVYIQSFEVGNLQYVNSITDIRIAQLLNRQRPAVRLHRQRRWPQLCRPGQAQCHWPAVHRQLCRRRGRQHQSDDPAGGRQAGHTHHPGGRCPQPGSGGAWLDLPRREHLPAQRVRRQRRSGRLR